MGIPAAASRSSGCLTGGSWRRSTNTSIIRPSFAQPPALHCTVVGGSTVSACPTRFCARCTMPTPCVICRRRGRRWRSILRRGSRIAHRRKPMLPAPLAALLAHTGLAQVTYDRLLKAPLEPSNWLLYGGDYRSHHYSSLDQITAENVHHLRAKWIYQMHRSKGETTPIVVDGIMYVTRPPSDVMALDAETGRALWTFEYSLSARVYTCCGEVNRGLAILGHTLYITTLDAKLIALDARSGRMLWKKDIADPGMNYTATAAPLAVKDKIIAGMAGAEGGVRGFLDAYEAKTGARIWRFWTIPARGEPGFESWDGDSWQHGGGSTWVTGSYDPELNLLYWGTGNPGPDYNGDVRPGDNLYSCSLLALNPDTGALKWHFQFTPHDTRDWDATQVPVLLDSPPGERRPPAGSGRPE